jgi:hypothetical protein
MNPRNNESKKEIESVDASDGCAESYPCHHFLTIKYKDGTSKKAGADGREIAEKYFNYLNDGEKQHFSQYLKQSGYFKTRLNAQEENYIFNVSKNKI